ncbi:MAG TPA: hypothetical protein ENK18_17120 [Deltaproteobacteria bacterium]|nr:hypothetical protein [Deltaproteobacteria bacterium]
MIATSVLLALLGCTGDPTVGTLSQNVGEAFAPCSEAEIRYLASKHNFMTAFRPCGNNHFQDYAWSPDGRKLYFQLGMSHHIMDAESPTKDTRVVPSPSPTGPGIWVSPTRLVVPVGPPPDAPDGPPQHLALYDTEQATIFDVAVPAQWGVIADLQRDSDPGSVLLTAEIGGRPRPFRIDLSDGSVSEPFPWLGDVDTLTFTPEADALVIGSGETVTLYQASTGTPRGSWSPALRGSLHRDGRWLMLEHEAEPVSVFYQRAWDELSEAARERELRRAKRFEEQLPETFETEVRPPTLSFVDLPTSRRWRIDSVYGHDFEWYNPTPFYGSFVLWGFEGKQFKRNVLLGDFTSRMHTAAAGGTFIGVEPFGPEQGASYTPAPPSGAPPSGAPTKSEGP